MPFLKKISTEKVNIGLWQLTEPYSELDHQIISEADKKLAGSFKSEQRKREFLAVRLLLTHMLGFYPDIRYDLNRRPTLANSPYKLSISHSRSMVAVMLAPVAAGVDTEETTRKVSAVASRFLSADELNWISQTGDRDLTIVLCWSMKESVFKMAETSNADFRSDIQISPFIADQEGIAPVTYKGNAGLKKADVHYQRVDNSVVSWCIEAEQPDGQFPGSEEPR